MVFLRKIILVGVTAASLLVSSFCCAGMDPYVQKATELVGEFIAFNRHCNDDDLVSYLESSYATFLASAAVSVGLSKSEVYLQIEEKKRAYALAVEMINRDYAAENSFDHEQHCKFAKDQALVVIDLMDKAERSWGF